MFPKVKLSYLFINVIACIGEWIIPTISLCDDHFNNAYVVSYYILHQYTGISTFFLQFACEGFHFPSSLFYAHVWIVFIYSILRSNDMFFFLQKKRQRYRHLQKFITRQTYTRLRWVDEGRQTYTRLRWVDEGRRERASVNDKESSSTSYLIKKSQKENYLLHSNSQNWG